MPEFWPLSTKANKYVTTPMPGPHPKSLCIPLRVLVRDSLKLAENTDEVRKILNAGKIMVDKKVRKGPHFPVGFMDIFEIPDLHMRFRLNVDKKGLMLEKVNEDETGFKLCRITSKTTIKGGSHQLNLHDGRNIITKGPYRVGDSILIEIPSQKIAKHYSLKKGEPAIIIAGKNRGASGSIKEIKGRRSMLEKSMIKLETGKGKEIETLKEYVMAGSLYRGETEDRRRQETPSKSAEEKQPRKKSKE